MCYSSVDIIMAKHTKFKMKGRGVLDENKEAISNGLNQAYEATSVVGKISTIIGTIFLNLILVIFLIIGIVLVRKKDNLTASTRGTVTDAKCSRDGKSTHCDGTIKYEVNGTKYTKQIGNGGIINKGDVKTIRYDPSNPNEFSTSSASPKTIGWIMIGVSVILLILSWVWAWFVLSYKLAAAATGVGAVADMAIPN